MDNRYSLSSLLHQYIDIFRGLQLEQGNAITTYLNSQREMNRSLVDLLYRYLEIERNTLNISQPPNNLFSSTRIPPPPQIPTPTVRPPRTSLFSFNNNRAPSQSPISNTPFNFSFESNTRNRNQPSNRTARSINPRDIPISSSNRLRGRGRGRRRPTRIRATTNVTTTTIPRDVFQNFINNTLNMGNIPQPLSASDISHNITNLTFNQLDENNTQTICPFTQDNFQENDEISRINPCGHIFTRTHLHRYLSNFDYRCPVCRRDLRRENDVENPTPVNNLLDLSSNFTTLSTTENQSQTRNIINNAVESVTNALMSNITNQINRDPSRNTFIAEYSFLLPQINSTSQNNITTNLTPNFTSTADDDLHDYLGLPPRNNTTQTSLPPLPEDTDTDMPELEEDFNDDDDDDL